MRVLLLPTLLLLATGVVGNAQTTDVRPNIIVIVADDLGYADLGCQGRSKDVRTPNIDTLASNGVRFTNGYVSCPVCSPTRAGLITGRYQQRFGHEFNPRAASPGQEFGLPLTEVTLADRLKKAGYATGMVGKWHLGGDEKRLPLSRGFDSFFGFPAGAHSYIDAMADSNNPIYRGRERYNEKEYLTDAFSREACAFVEQHAGKTQPFFLYLTYNAIHTPQQAPEKYLARFADVRDVKRRTMLAMLSAMDDGVGAVLEHVRKAGAMDNTLVFFISDNGGPTAGNGSRNDPLRGFKGEVLEGGIRVPFLVQWPRVLPKGRVYDAPVISLDIHATAVAAARASVSAEKPLDGVNLLPFLTGDKKTPPHEALYWRFGQQWAIRKGDWKAAVARDETLQLFDLRNDPGESRNLAGEKAEVLAELVKDYDAWNAQLAQPLWGGGGGGGRAARAARPGRADRADRADRPRRAGRRAASRPARQ